MAMRESEIVGLFMKHLRLQGELPLGDDAGAFRLDSGWLVATNDMLVWKTDVPDVMTPEQAGFKAVTMNVSDVAAMGARPEGFLFSLGIPRDVDGAYLEGIARGIGRALDFYGVPVLSADTNEASELILDGMALGWAERLLTRSGARPGDVVCLTGDVGRALAGLLAWMEKLEVSVPVQRELYEKLLEPVARVREGAALGGMATSAIDISDGLSKELHIISEMSNVRIEVSGEALPIHASVVEVAHLLGRNPIDIALASGEEFELLFTIPRDRLDALGFKFSVIGTVEDGRGVFITAGGRREKMPLLGWEHLASPGGGL